MDYNNDPGRWSLADLMQCLNDSEGPLHEHLTRIANLLETEGNQNFILGKVIIENDLEAEEEEVEEDDDE